MISINWFIQYKLQITKDLNSQTNNPTYFFEKDINKNELDHFMLDTFLWNDINKIYDQLIPDLEKDLQKLELKKKTFSIQKITLILVFFYMFKKVLQELQIKQRTAKCSRSVLW